MSSVLFVCLSVIAIHNWSFTGHMGTDLYPEFGDS